MDKEEKEAMYSKIKQIMEKQLELLSSQSQEAVALTELAEISRQMVSISEFLVELPTKIF